MQPLLPAAMTTHMSPMPVDWLSSRAGDTGTRSSPLMITRRFSRANSCNSTTEENNVCTTTTTIQQTPRTNPTTVINNDTPNQLPPTKLWKLHGKYYDLTPFLNQHPGGSTILKLAQGEPDCTPLFESYHAFANLDAINKQLAKYEVNAELVQPDTRPQPMITYTFEETGFYNTLRRRVREHFGNTKGYKESVNKNVKANTWWLVKVSCQYAIFFACWFVAFFQPNVSMTTSIMASIVAAIVITGLGMTTFHDASHYAVKEKNHFINAFIMRFWAAIALWDPQMWLTHHTVRHHTYTGDEIYDPDTQHARPFVRKHPDAPRNKYINFGSWRTSSQRWFFAVWAFIIYVLAPGMFIGQVLSYHVIWRFKGHLWKMGTPTPSFDRKWWEAVISAMMLSSHVYKFWQTDMWTGMAVTGAYIVTLNLTYAMCILPDHDTFESAIENRSTSQEQDWGEVQVRHSSDFGGRGLIGRTFAQMFGSINVQIAHHVFPSVSHVYLPQVALIVEQTCKEFGVPYASHETLSGAVWSFIKTIHTCMGPVGESVKIE